MENICPERSEEILLGYNSGSNSSDEKTYYYRTFTLRVTNALHSIGIKTIGNMMLILIK